jgi:hypothetical protein
MNRLDVIDGVRQWRVRNGLAVGKLVAAKNLIGG